MFNVSGVIICYNEEKVIRKALECLKKFTDEIIVFDSFSTDGTMEILKEFGCKVYQHEFDNHRDQKNRAIEKCTKDWVFLLDSDEYLEDKLIANIPALINNTDGVDCIGMPRKNYLDGDGPLGYPDVQTRLFKNYCRHFGHPFHHMTNGNSKKHVITRDYGAIMHEKTWDRQKGQNQLYYFLRPQDYKEVPIGAENIVLDPEASKDPENVNAYRDFIKKYREKNIL